MPEYISLRHLYHHRSTALLNKVGGVSNTGLHILSLFLPRSTCTQQSRRLVGETPTRGSKHHSTLPETVSEAAAQGAMFGTRQLSNALIILCMNLTSPTHQPPNQKAFSALFPMLPISVLSVTLSGTFNLFLTCRNTFFRAVLKHTVKTQ